MIHLILLFLSVAQAGDQWLCTEESSILRGSSIYACGVATSKDEALARAEAYEESYREFSRITGKQPISVQPQRTSCTRSIEGYKCYRLVVYSIQPEEPIDISLPENNPPPPAPAKIYVGMSRKDLFFVLGDPKSYNKVSFTGVSDARYRGDMCVYASQGCNVFIKNDMVQDIQSVKPEYIRY